MFPSSYQSAPTKTEKEFAALSYLWIFSVLIYFSPHGKTAYVRHHARQGMMLFLLSILIYFLPGILSYINVFTVFLMILGVIEAALGSQYRLPLLSDWLEGKFHERHFSLFHFWWDTLKGKFQKKESILLSSVEEKTFQQSFEEYLAGQSRKKWSPEIQAIEDMIESHLNHDALRIHKNSYGLELFHERKSIFHFGGVKDNQFLVAYRKHDVPVPGDEQSGVWTLKYYDVNSFKKESFEALLSLVMDV